MSKINFLLTDAWTQVLHNQPFCIFFNFQCCIFYSALEETNCI